MQNLTPSILADTLKPYVVKWIDDASRSWSVANATGSAGGMSSHELGGPLHIGALRTTQAPWAMLTDGTRPLTGNLAVDAGITIDGVDLSAHAANVNAHHNQSHVLATTAGLGNDHTVSGLTAGQYLRASGATSAAFASILDADIPSTIVRTSRTLTAGDGLSGLGDLSADRTIDLELSATSGLELFGTSPAKTLQLADTVAGAGLTITGKVLAVGVTNTLLSAAGATGLTVEADTLRLTTTNNPGAAASVLSSSAAGALTLPSFIATTSVNTPLLTTTSGDLTIDPAGVVKFPTAQTLKSADFDSSFPILGWQINEVIGVTGQSALTIGKIAADELSVKVFVADETRVDRANQYWTKSYGIVAESFTTPSAIGGTVTVKFEDSPALAGAIFTVNDWLLFRIIDISTGLIVANAWGQVSNYVALPEDPDLGVTLQSWTFTLRSGATSTVIKKGRTAVDFGASGAALIHLSVLDAAGAPYIKMRKWAGANPYEPANFTTYVQIGELASVSNASLPYAPSGYGLYVRSGTAAGRAILVDDNGLMIQGADFRLYDGTNNTMLLSAGAGNDSPVFAMGATLPTGALVNDGIWAGKDGSAYKWRVGTVSGGALVKGIYWDGTNLIWKATNTSLDASGNLVAGPVTLSSAGVTSAATNDYANNAAYKFTSSGIVTSGTFAYATPTDTSIWMSTNLWGGSSLVQDAARNAYTRVGAYAHSLKDAFATFEAETRDSYGATVKLAQIVAAANGAQSSLDLTADTVKANTYTIWHAGNDGHGSTLDADTLDTYHASSFALLSGATFTGHLKAGTTNAYDIGEAGVKWRTIYVGNIVADTISGTSLSGATWRNDASDMGIYSSAAGTRTLAIANDGAGVMNVEIDGSLKVVTGNITLEGSGATVDGVDVSAHAANVNAHHAQSHVLAGSDHTASGLTAGWVLRASAATTFAWAQLAHSDLSGVGTNSHATIDSHISATAAHGATGAVVGTTNTQTLSGKTLTTPTIADFTNATHAHAGATSGGTIAHTSLTAIGTNTHAAIDTHIGTADTHVAHSGVSILGGNGLTGGGAINATQTLHVAVSGLGLSVGADAVTLTSSNNPGEAASILATNSTGGFSVSGNVGIGTSDPGYNLDVAGIPAVGIGSIRIQAYSGSSYNFLMSAWADANASVRMYASGIEFLRINPNSNNALSLQPAGGNVGIGTSSPGVRLDVNGNIRTVAGAGVDAGVTFGALVSTYGARITRHSDDAVIFGAPGTTVSQRVSIVTSAGGGIADFRGDGSSYFYGNVGIGTTSPQALLHASGTGDRKIRLESTTDTNQSHVALFLDNSALSVNGQKYSWGIQGFAADGRLRFYDGSAGGYGEVMSLSRSGYVGIGNTSPTYKLDVSGTGRFTGVLYADSDLDVGGTSYIESAIVGSGKLVRSSTFTSGFAGSGWQIDDGIITTGRMSAEFDDLTIRGRMRVYELLVNQIRATNGSVFVSSTGKAKTATLVSGASYTIATDSADNHGFLEGDLIRAQRFDGTGVFQCDMQVTAVANPYTFTATLIAGDAPLSGYEFVRLGSATDASRRGSIYLTADDSGAPFIDIVDGINSHAAWNGRTANAGVRARLGRITGITGTANEYGLWAGTGTGDTAQSLVASSQGVTLTNTPISFKAGASTVVMQLSPGAGNASPSIALGATLPTGPLVNDGIWFGKDGSDYEFRVGSVSGGALVKGVHWDGANLAWAGVNTSLTAAGVFTATSGTVGGWTLNTDALTATNIGLFTGAANVAHIRVGDGTANSAGLNSVTASTDWAIWSGAAHGNRATAPFRVRADGYLYASNAEISGAITATSGTFTGAINASSGGITGALTMGASGSITATSTVLNADGIEIAEYANSFFAEANAYKFKNGSTVHGSMAQRYDSSDRYLEISVNKNLSTGAAVDSTKHMWAILAAKAASTKTARVDLMATSAGVESSVKASSNPYGSAITISSTSISVLATTFTFNGNTIWHSGNDDGADVGYLGGYSAASYARLAAANSWSAIQTFNSGLTFGTLVSTYGARITRYSDNVVIFGVPGTTASQSVSITTSAGSGIVDLRGDGSSYFYGNVGIGNGLRIGGDPGAGAAGQISLSNVTAGVGGTQYGFVVMNGNTIKYSTGWLKIWVAGNAKYIPYWDEI